MAMNPSLVPNVKEDSRHWNVTKADCGPGDHEAQGSDDCASRMPGAAHTDTSDTSETSSDKPEFFRGIAISTRNNSIRINNNTTAAAAATTNNTTTNNNNSFNQNSRETDDGSSSSTTLTTQRPNGPQTEQLDNSWQEEEHCNDFVDEETQQNKNILIRHLSLTSMSGRLTLINLSRRGLGQYDALTIQQAIVNNPHLAVLKLSYNNLGDNGAAIISQGFVHRGVHHKCLSTLDMGFNAIKDPGCAALALHAVAGNHALKILYLSGNNIKYKGAMAMAGAILHGCSLTALYISANKIGSIGIQALARAVGEREALKTMMLQDESKNYNHAPTMMTLEELHVSDCAMESSGFVTIPSMLLTNFSMRILCLSNNNIHDNDMALLAQAFARNKDVPLEVLQLSHNTITCVGIECIMNAVWGSKTLKEMRFDNNQIRDRGAQLFAVVLTSIALEVIDLSGNRITAVGIKALMKSLSENQSLSYLGLCGIPIDDPSARALSYGIAYNATLKYLYIDKCSVGYAAQRHVVAGIISNRFAALRVLTGFPIGAIVATLGLPKALESWTNDQVLGFIRFMWKLWREEQGTDDHEKSGGPAAPASVVAAAKKAMQSVGEDGASSLITEPHQRDISDTSPLATMNATLLERTLSGTIRVPPIVQGLKGSGSQPRLAEAWTESGMETVNSQRTRIVTCDSPKYDPVRKDQNLEWLRLHFRSLHEIGRLPFSNADLWQLHQYFFSPISATDENPSEDGSPVETDTDETGSNVPENEKHERMREPSRNDDTGCHSTQPKNVSQAQEISPLPADASHRASLGRAISFQLLDDALVANIARSPCLSSSFRRRALEMMSGDEEDSDDFSTSSSESDEVEPVSKRAKNFKPRIAYYPRIREKLESVGLKPTQETLSLLRHLKFVENVLFQGKNAYHDDEVRAPDQPTPADVEMIILDLL